MPNEVIVQVQHMATTTEKYDGIVFTDINGNVLSEQFDKDADDTSNVPEDQPSEYTQGNDTYNVNNGMMAIQSYCNNWKVMAIAKTRTNCPIIMKYTMKT